MEDIDIYGTPAWETGLLGAAVAWAVGLLLLVGGFILISRFLIDRRLQRAEQEWLAEEAEAQMRKAAESDGDAKGDKKPEG
jgi:flagellar biosynthesis/type III secretory pathway M-ring protein FliF/YscJ